MAKAVRVNSRQPCAAGLVAVSANPGNGAMRIETPEQSWQLRESDNRAVVYFSLGLTLEDIPVPDGLCSHCRSPRQKELLPFETETSALVVCATPTPGYGCTGADCGLKDFTPPVAINLLTSAASEIRKTGDTTSAQWLEQQARELREALDRDSTHAAR